MEITSIGKLNKFQTPIDSKLLDSLTKYEREQLLEYITSVKFISNLIASEEVRGFAKDRPNHCDLPNSDERRLYNDERVVVDISNPHILTDMDFFRERAIFFQKYGVYTHLRVNPNPKSEYIAF